MALPRLDPGRSRVVSVFVPIKRSELHSKVGVLSCRGRPACASGKFMFESRKLARRFLRSKSGAPNFTACRVYRCPQCGHWHVTSQEQTR